MNVSQNINKLLYVLTSKGQLYKINSFKFYSQKTNKYCTKYQILKRKIIEVYNPETEKIEYQEKYKQDYECYNKIDLMKYLAEEHRKGSEANGR